MKLNENERKVLQFLVFEFSDEFGFYSFAGISAVTRLDRRRVRLACRSLARKGLTRFCHGLWSPDGEPRGSGYGATDAGADFINKSETSQLTEGRSAAAPIG